MSKKLQQNLVALVIFAGGIIFVYYNYLLTPLKQKHESSIKQLQQTEAKLKDTRRRALELPKLQAEMKQLTQEVADLEKLLPKNKEIPSLLRMITQMAQRYQLKISNFVPGGIASQPNYNEVPFQVTLQGTYHSLASFLAHLGQETRILNERNINFAATPPSRENSATINVSFTLVAYTYKE